MFSLRNPLTYFGGWVLICLVVGCGTTRDKLATDQLLLSDAVDRSVAQIDFSPLRGETVFLDVTYLRQIKSPHFVNADYIISSLRQQIVLSGCFLVDDREEAEFIAEPRVGVLGTDGHDVNFGVPGNPGLSAAATLVGSGVPLPALPEISLARRADDTAAAKVAVFAYHRETREPVWQSGTSVARSTARARWVLGAGPFQSGTIYDGTHFAGGRLTDSSPLGSGESENGLTSQDSAYRSPALWYRRLQDKLFVDSDAPALAQQEGAAQGQRPDDLEAHPPSEVRAATHEMPIADEAGDE